MAANEKQTMPPYAPYKAFSNFINGLRGKVMPSHLNRSILPGSNSGKATMSATLRALDLIDKDDVPTQKLRKLVESDDAYKEELKALMMATYPFLTDGSLDLKTTTTEKVTEKFRSAGANGSTVSKCMAFFLAASKAAGIEVSPYVKAPTSPKGTSTAKKRGVEVNNDEEEEIDQAVDFEGMLRIPIPLHGMDDGIILFPDGMNKRQWEYALKMAEFILKNYRPDLEEGNE